MFYALLGLLCLFALVWLISSIGHRRIWERRPKRLCLYCHTTQQPVRNKHYKGLFCAVCQAPNPVPLDSPAAAEYFAHAGGLPPA